MVSVGRAIAVWMIANSSPPSRATTSPARDAGAQAAGDRLQQFVPDGVPERIVDPLELVDIDVEHRQLTAGRQALQLMIEALAEQHAVRQIGQRVVMRHVRDTVIDPLALGDVLHRGNPAAALDPLANDLDRSSVRRGRYHRR